MCKQLLGLTLTLTICCALRAADAPGRMSVGDRTCLFLDDHYVAKQDGLTRTFHQGQPHAKAVIAEEHPWEHWITLWGSCFYDAKYEVYRMYYQSTLQPSGVPGVSFRDNLCYAESKDGINWIKPKLRLVESHGSKDNNILFSFAGPISVIVDPLATEPAGRLKLFTYPQRSDPRFGADGIICMQSEDGIHWTTVGSIQVPQYAKPQNPSFNDNMQIEWDALKQCYLGCFDPLSQHAIGDIQGNQRRAIGITWSNDLMKGWSPAELIVKADDEDDRRAATWSKDPAQPDWAELYTMSRFTYGNHYIGFIAIFDVVDRKDCNGGGDLQLAFSNDGQTWMRPQPRFTAMAQGDDPELRPTFAQFNAALDMGDETWVYYCETNGPHGVTPFDKSRGRIRAGVWRKDGFASMDCAEKGSLTTKPFVFTGDELRVNFKAGAGGKLRVALVDETGQPFSGFVLEECESITGDSVSRAVSWWRKGNDVSSLAGRKVALHFDVSKGELYGFRFAKK